MRPGPPSNLPSQPPLPAPLEAPLQASLQASSYTALVVAERPAVGELLADGLGPNGYDVTWVRSAPAARLELARSTYDVALVDVDLPDGGGVDVVRTIRSNRSETIVLIVTEREADVDVILGLDAGADDYVVQPVNLIVLLARLRAHLRRLPAHLPADGAVLAVDDLTVDPAGRRCLVGEVEIPLRAKEFDLLNLLVDHRGEMVSRHDLMSQVWDENWSGSTKILDVTMVGLRRRLRESAAVVGAAVPEIVTVRGRGYRLDARQDRALRGA